MSILKEMESIVTTNQSDLDKAVNEIKNLQVWVYTAFEGKDESDRISLRLKNRKEVDTELREIVNELSIKPSMVSTLISVGCGGKVRRRERWMRISLYNSLSSDVVWITLTVSVWM